VEPEEVLTKAYAAVEGAGIPPELREVALSKAIDLYSGTVLSGPDSSEPDSLPPKPRDGASVDEALSEGLRGVAEFFDLPHDEVEDYFAEDDEGELNFTNDPDELGSSTQAAVRALSLLLGAARKAGGYDSTSTSIEVFRNECVRHGIYDQNNFSSQVGGMTTHFVINGSGKSRTFTLKPTGRKDAKKVMNKLVGRD
jgi:hypothetical protein